ncbi:conserved hypothetical protein [Gloeothece citriformis PCC 7424]|uniref:Uncharacterized protein n=1 Tax=Gloeothece citriformis (strain PCC 7424) TaxID=65393 RepID=B7KEU6_GLOC7|nr:hypothetical protein [Gloeothece citriformis]ACK69121.1 conserved hypothetical protein [Gloeothece citriformis PCC 7424]
MPNKRSRFNKTQKFYCPYCSNRLWRVGSPKYHLFHQGKLEIQKGLNLTSKKAAFLAAQQSTLVNNNLWLEEFFCEKDGKIWMYLEKHSNGQLATRLASREDWQRTTKTPDPERPHNTVSEFTHKMSRQANVHLVKKYNF